MLPTSIPSISLSLLVSGSLSTNLYILFSMNEKWGMKMKIENEDEKQFFEGRRLHVDVYVYLCIQHIAYSRI